jgi:hypothetical protein
MTETEPFTLFAALILLILMVLQSRHTAWISPPAILSPRGEEYRLPFARIFPAPATRTAGIVLALALVWLVSACSPQASTPDAAEEVPHLDALVSAVTSGSAGDLLPLVRFSALPCTNAEGLGGPPKCIAGEAEGTLVDVLPVLGPEGHHRRRSDFSSWPGLDDAQLYAAFRTPESTYTDEFFPRGEYGVAFSLANQTFLIFQMTDEGIVRLDYDLEPSIAGILDESEVILTPAAPAD